MSVLETVLIAAMLAAVASKYVIWPAAVADAAAGGGGGDDGGDDGTSYPSTVNAARATPAAAPISTAPPASPAIPIPDGHGGGVPSMHGGGGAEYPLERSGSSSSASGGKLHAIVEDAAAGSAAIREAGNGAAGQQDTRSRSAPARPTGGGDELAEPDHMILGLSKVQAARLSSNENDTV